MLVSELIKLLQNCDPDAQVVSQPDHEYGHMTKFTAVISSIQFEESWYNASCARENELVSYVVLG